MVSVERLESVLEEALCRENDTKGQGKAPQSDAESDPFAAFREILVQNSHVVAPLDVAMGRKASTALVRFIGCVEDIQESHLYMHNPRVSQRMWKRTPLSVRALPRIVQGWAEDAIFPLFEVFLLGKLQYEDIRIGRMYEFTCLYSRTESGDSSANMFCVEVKPDSGMSFEGLNESDLALEKSRDALLMRIKDVLCLDSLSAQYLLFSLLSKSRERTDSASPPIGKMALNLVLREGASLDVVNRTNTLCSLLRPLTKYVELSLENLEALDFESKKDFDTGDVKHGELHVSSSTLILLNETKMTTGELGPKALNNLKAVQQMLMNQVFSVDFDVQKVEIAVDCPSITFSLGSRSLLQQDFHVIVDAVEGEALDFPVEEELLRWRGYIERARYLLPSIPDNLSPLIEADLIQLHKNHPKEDAQLLMSNAINLALLVARSFLASEVTRDHWEMAKSIEVERRARSL